MSEEKSQFRYFRSVEGKVVGRFGKDSYIGVRRTKEGWDWNTEDVFAIPTEECRRYVREYKRALKSGALIEVTKKDFDQVNAAENQTEKKERPTKADRRRARRSMADKEG
jgi:hypothetical protein